MVAAGVALSLLASAAVVHACGIEWRVPVTHFDGVDEKGHVCYSKMIGSVECGEGLELPLIITFRSDRESSSPYLGKGWILALLDSSFVQTGENSFFMVQPDGWTRPFYRGKVQDTVLNGGPDWKAEINGDTITAWTGCGWKLIYSKGRLTGIVTPKSRQIEFVWSRGKVTELREGGLTKLSVDYDEATGQTRVLSFNGKRVEIGWGERPRVQTIAGQNVVAGMEQSLHRIALTNSAPDLFEFAVDSQVRPTLKISGSVEQMFTWDPSSKRITKDNEWTYDIQDRQGLKDHAFIERKNSQNQRESWALDAEKGLEITEAISGERTLVRRFASGILAGLMRSREVYRGDVLVSSERCQYDQNAEPLRVVRDGLVINYEKGKLLNVMRNGKPVWEVSYDAKGGVKQVQRFPDNDSSKENISQAPTN